MTATAAVAGIGARQPHLAELIESGLALPFVEVHSENHFAEGGAALAVLDGLRLRYPVSLHGVGLGLGSATGLDERHLDQLARLVQRAEPLRVSDHACFARAVRAPGGPVVHAADLLPIAFTEASLEILVHNVTQVQERLRRPIAVENLASYLSFADETIAEPEFLSRLCRRTGCGLLLDLNNLMVNALNAGAADPAAACRAWVDALPRGIVAEIHLAGWRDADGLAIDDHGSRVREPVWALYRHAVQRLGTLPTLIEWDTDLPALDVLLAEAARADSVANGALP